MRIDKIRLLDDRQSVRSFLGGDSPPCPSLKEEVLDFDPTAVIRAVRLIEASLLEGGSRSDLVLLTGRRAYWSLRAVCISLVGPVAVFSLDGLSSSFELGGVPVYQLLGGNFMYTGTVGTYPIGCGTDPTEIRLGTRVVR